MKTIFDLYKDKENGVILAYSTAYNFWQGKICNDANCDLVLVGDSSAQVEDGHNSTIFINLEEMLSKVRAVRRGFSGHIVGDFNFGSYEISNEQAVETAIKFIKNGANSVKLENANQMSLDRIKAISDAGIVVQSHCSISPQSASNTKTGFRCLGKDLKSFEKIVNDVCNTIKAGAQSVLIEGFADKSTQQIRNIFPDTLIFSIGAGKADGILSIFSDTCGNFPLFRPFFSKNFVYDIINDFTDHLNNNIVLHYGGNAKKFGREFPFSDGIYKIAQLCLDKYVKDVKCGVFPSKEYSFQLKEEELNELRKSQYWNSKFEFKNE